MTRVDEPVLLHNPRCSKSRATKELLEQRRIAFRTRLYLEEPLDERELKALVVKLGLGASDWIRADDRAFREGGLTLEDTEDELLRAVAAHPALLQRPILVKGDRAAIGRPPDNVLRLFGE